MNWEKFIPFTPADHEKVGLARRDKWSIRPLARFRYSGGGGGGAGRGGGGISNDASQKNHLVKSILRSLFVTKLIYHGRIMMKSNHQSFVEGT